MSARLNYRKEPAYARAADDWYQEGPQHVSALLARESFEGLTLDPACGEGNIPRVLRQHGVPAIGSDLRDRGYGTPGIDFLTDSIPQVANICSNPPYQTIPWPESPNGKITMGELFVDKALTIATRKVAMLLPLTFLESARRKQRYEGDWPLAYVYVFADRVSMPPGGMGIEATGGKKAFAWFVFHVGRHVGDPPVRWL